MFHMLMKIICYLSEIYNPVRCVGLADSETELNKVRKKGEKLFELTVMKTKVSYMARSEIFQRRKIMIFQSQFQEWTTTDKLERA